MKLRRIEQLVLSALLLVTAGSAQEAPLSPIPNQSGGSTPATMQSSSDEVDDKFIACLTSLASYSRWMIAANPHAQPDKLHIAVDAAYNDVQSEWTGPYSARKYLLAAYLFATCSYFVYLLVVVIVRRLRPARFPVGRPPDWRWESRAIVAGVLLLVAAAITERWVTFLRMQQEYTRLSAYLREFVELRQPAQLANSTDDPCQQLAGSPNVSLAECTQRFAAVDKGKAESVEATRFLSRDLVKQRRDAATTCAAVTELPSWYADSATHQVEYELAVQRPLIVDGNVVVSVKDLVRLSDLKPWLTSQSANAVRLKLEDAFAVGTAIGEPWAYQQKVRILLGPESHREFAARYLRTSAACIVVGAILLTILASTLWRLRRDELAHGSTAAARQQRLTMYGSLAISAALALISVFFLGVV